MQARVITSGATGYSIRFVLLTAASVAGAFLGFALLPAGASATLVWPSSAIGIAALFLYGYELWPAILLSVVGVLFLRNGNIPLDIAVGLGNTVEALLGAYILKRYVNFNPLINSLGNGIGIIAASVIPTLISAGVVTLASYFLGRIAGGGIEDMWSDLWIGHAVTCLSFAPFIIRWLYRPFFTKTQDEIVEGIFVFSSIVAVSYFLFWTSLTSIGSVSLVYILILPLLWASIRTGPRGTTFALALISIISTTGVIYGQGALSAAHNPQTIFLLQVLLGVLDLIFILIAAVIEERKDVTNSLAASVAELKEAVEKISQEDQAKANFLAILAHELRNPLAPIVSSIELLKLEESMQQHSALIETIESHTQTISLLLNDLLDITRITHNKFELKQEEAQLQYVIKRSLETVKTFVTSRKHTLHVHMPEAAVLLYVDPIRLEQVFVNLLNNAAKYTDEGGTITLTAVVRAGHAIVTVADNGIGMSANKIGSIFEMFGQIRDTGRGSGGLGVGLALTKRLIDLHDGTIEAKSLGLGRGSEFTVRLPLMRTSLPKKSILESTLLRAKEISHGGPKTLRVLVVDDNQPAAKGLAKLLEHAGHITALAFDGRAALTLAQEFKPDVVVLDIGLPDVSGFEVAQQMRLSIHTPLRLIALTGYGQEGDRTKTREAGFDAHLVKPVGIADLQKALR